MKHGIGCLSHAPIPGPAVNQACVLTRKRTDQGPFGLWDDTQPTEPYQPGLYYFPIAAVTNYHKLNGLIKHRLIFL